MGTSPHPIMYPRGWVYAKLSNAFASQKANMQAGDSQAGADPQAPRQRLSEAGADPQAGSNTQAKTPQRLGEAGTDPVAEDQT